MLSYNEEYLFEGVMYNFNKIYKVQKDSDLILVKCPSKNYRKNEIIDVFSLENEIEKISSNKNLSSKDITLHKIFFNLNEADYSLKINDYCKKITISDGIFKGKVLTWSINVRWKSVPNLVSYTSKYNRNNLQIPEHKNCKNKNILTLVKYTNDSIIIYDYFKEVQLNNAKSIYLFDKESNSSFIEPCGVSYFINE
ncbi:Hypothetical protein SRAE_1000097200 [Strongyloides ratti]|uniref:DUF7585 domain-containing protein n=1 Tax=Strongyloides ratti TaxID=34506 RepID=A0A090L3Q8_STRRB|nr:Hypothetical protein SRAE_1000097200 [Strongyloides ratti]CEF62702.1 Hypothetical protein SRAE_1000097200 [Strongyloides ratti]